jgi:chloramphenicol-sensitive protein RarD
MNEPKKGILAIIAAAVIWGLAPLYYKLLEHVPPFELLSHRTFWSFIFFIVVLYYSRRLDELWAAMFDRSDAFFLLIAAFLVATNWFFFIYSIQTNQATEASLGYFILPLVSILFGMLVFKETLSSGQWLSVRGIALKV